MANYYNLFARLCAMNPSKKTVRKMTKETKQVLKDLSSTEVIERQRDRIFDKSMITGTVIALVGLLLLLLATILKAPAIYKLVLVAISLPSAVLTASLMAMVKELKLQRRLKEATKDAETLSWVLHDYNAQMWAK